MTAAQDFYRWLTPPKNSPAQRRDTKSAKLTISSEFISPPAIKKTQAPPNPVDKPASQRPQMDLKSSFQAAFQKFRNSKVVQRPDYSVPAEPSAKRVCNDLPSRFKDALQNHCADLDRAEAESRSQSSSRRRKVRPPPPVVESCVRKPKKHKWVKTQAPPAGESDWSTANGDIIPAQSCDASMSEPKQHDDEHQAPAADEEALPDAPSSDDE